ncbi:peptidoglycan-binding protein [Agromyces sp. Root81]|uniref:peptidoglycan-binding domain-containing protein n=1 Tax=Agromyces sp. Root81 TaxID=1736601 RepID=UPI000B0E5410|nr:peptidoglycan-binding domain-containing protein [Agromyces sp. Root81]
MTDNGPMNMNAEKPRRRWWRIPVLVVSLLAVGAVAGWAVTAVFAPPRDVLSETPYTYVELVDGEVGSSMQLNTVAEWQPALAATNQASGTVTSVTVAPGDEVRAGSVLYSVNLRPVVVAAGATPVFRPLSREAKGSDVQQLQQLLTELGFYSGAVDGEFGSRTEAAVKDWQDSLGIGDDGVVQPGDVVFVPTLPTRVTLDPEIVFRGASLSGGEAAVSALSAEPVFTIPVTVSQAGSMPVGTAVEVQAPDGTVWAAEVASQKPSEESGDQVDVVLQGVGGATICGAGCGTLPAEGSSRLLSKIVTQPTVTGVVAPSAALLSATDGTISVVDDEGERHEVAVVAAAKGMSVIDGAPAGMRVRVPASGEEAAGGKS